MVTPSVIGTFLGKFSLWWSKFVTMLPTLMFALVVLIVFSVVSRIARRLVKWLMLRAHSSEALARLTGSITRLIILSVGIFTALTMLNLDKVVTSLLAGAGIIGLALSFAFQDLVTNFISGCFIAFQHPFKKGDFIKTHEFTGTVERIFLRHTEISTLDKNIVLIPNRKLFENPLTNYSSAWEKNVILEIGVSGDDDLRKVEKIAVDTIKKKVKQLSDKKSVNLFFTKFGESTIDLSLSFKVKNGEYMKARHDAIIALNEAFAKAKLTMPFPTTTLDLNVKQVRQALRKK